MVMVELLICYYSLLVCIITLVNPGAPKAVLGNKISGLSQFFRNE